MLIIDDLLLWLPLKGLVAVTRQIEEVAKKEMKAGDKRYNSLLAELRNERSLFRKGKISQTEYENRAIIIIQKMAKI